MPSKNLVVSQSPAGVQYAFSCGFKESANIAVNPDLALTLGSRPQCWMQTASCPFSVFTCQHLGPFVGQGQPSRPGKHLKFKLILKSLSPTLLRGRVKRAVHTNCKKTCFFT